MHNINDKINKREQSKFWSKEIAGRVVTERSRRAKRKLTVTGSLFIVFFLFFVIGYNISLTKTESTTWSDTFISEVTESIYPYMIPQDVDEFITYSFNGE